MEKSPPPKGSEMVGIYERGELGFSPCSSTPNLNPACSCGFNNTSVCRESANPVWFSFVLTTEHGRYQESCRDFVLPNPAQSAQRLKLQKDSYGGAYGAQLRHSPRKAWSTLWYMEAVRDGGRQVHLACPHCISAASNRKHGGKWLLQSSARQPLVLPPTASAQGIGCRPGSAGRWRALEERNRPCRANKEALHWGALRQPSPTAGPKARTCPKDSARGLSHARAALSLLLLRLGLRRTASRLAQGAAGRWSKPPPPTFCIRLLAWTTSLPSFCQPGSRWAKAWQWEDKKETPVDLLLRKRLWSFPEVPRSTLTLPCSAPSDMDAAVQGQGGGLRCRIHVTLVWVWCG